VLFIIIFGKLSFPPVRFVQCTQQKVTREWNRISRRRCAPRRLTGCHITLGLLLKLVHRDAMLSAHLIQLSTKLAQLIVALTTANHAHTLQLRKKSNTDIAVRHISRHAHRYGNSTAVWNHTVFPATRQRWHSRLNPSKAGTRFSDPGGMQSRVDLVGWLHTEIVYPPEDGHPSIQVLIGPDVG